MEFNYGSMRAGYWLRNEMGYRELEKRQLFLRSYQFSRKQSVGARIKKSFFRVKKVICVRFRSVRKLRKMLCFKLKNGFFFTNRRRRSFLPLHNYNYNYYYHASSTGSPRQLSSFW